MNVIRPLLVIGTRPEGIKMAPLVRACRQQADIEPIVCFTGQHQEMLQPIADYFGIEPDVDMCLMQPGQTLARLTSLCLEGLDEAIEKYRPSLVVAQGDTTTAMTAAMAAFYRQTPLLHVEAGLRTGNMLAPWPEEFNRRVATLVARVHCAPTRRAADQLLAEGVPESHIHVTGNPVIDALLWTQQREQARSTFWRRRHPYLGDRPMVLITGHRRENFGQPFQQICESIALLARDFPHTLFVYPVHLNPQVRAPVHTLLGRQQNIFLLEPLDYPEFVWLMSQARLLLTDSGGVQEEAPSLGKPVLVMRRETERPEAVEVGAARLVGTERDAIVRAVTQLLCDEQAYANCQVDHNPYGDGRATERIVALIRTFESGPPARSKVTTHSQ